MHMDSDSLFKNGMPWHRDEFTSCLNEQKIERIDNNFPSVILIDGGQGQGKTTLAIHCADYFNSLVGLQKVDLVKKHNKQLAMGGVDFISKFNRCRANKLPALIYDEAGDYSKASTLSWFNYQLSNLFQKIRRAKIIIIICLHNFNIIDNRLFADEIIRGAIHCYDRQKTRTHGNMNVYDINQLSWVRHWYSKFPPARRHACYSMVSPMFQCRFKNLPQTRAKQLAFLCDAGKERERQEAEVQMKGLLSVKDLAKDVNRSDIWVRKKLAEKRIKPAEVIGQRHYYGKSALKQLENILQTLIK